MFEIVEKISRIFNYNIDDVEYLDKCTIIRLNKDEVLDRIIIKEIQNISDIYKVSIDIRYSEMTDCIIIVVDI